jgi:hypothetical protein
LVEAIDLAIVFASGFSARPWKIKVKPQSKSAHFPENLAWVMTRLNLSRVELAHRIGVDKSVVRRWVLGQTQPSDLNLSMLTSMAAERIEGFTRDCWHDAPAALPSRFNGSSTNSHAADPLAVVFPHFGTKAHGALQSGLDRYAGVWAMLCVVAAPDGGHALFASGAMITDRDDQLWLHSSDGSAGMRTGDGPVFVSEDKLWMLLDEWSGRNDLCAILLNGSAAQQVVIMDGLYMVRSFMSGSPVAGRIRMFRLTDVPTDSREADALYRRVCDRSGELSRSNLAAQLPDDVAALLLGADSATRAASPNVMPVGPSDSMTTLALTVDLLADGPVRRRNTLDAVRALYRDALSPN